MAANPVRDPLKEAEARVRALTREVGALREDLRRETKRRERAVSQSQEAEAARSSAEHKLQELTYANRKLAAEVETAQAAAKAAGERDRRALRTLREGLAEVEGAVAQRAERGSLQVASAFRHVNRLREMLLSCGPPGTAPVLPHALANSVTHTLADIIQGLSALSALLTNAPDAEEQAAAALSAGSKDDDPGARDAGGTGVEQQQQQQQQSWPSIKEAGAAVLSAAKIDLEKEGLRDEVHRLRVQLRTLVEEQSGTANAAALSLQSQLRGYMAAAEAMQADLQAQIKERDAMVDSLRAELQHSTRIKGAEEEKVHAELLAKLHEQASEANALQAKLAAVQADLAAAEGICKESAATTEALGTQVHAQAARAEQAESDRSSMQAQLKGQSEEAEALRVEVRGLHQALHAMGSEGKALHAELERMQDRVHAAEAAGAGDAVVVAELRVGRDAAFSQVCGMQQKIAQLQESEAIVKQDWEVAQALLAEREAQLAQCQAQLASQATHLASLQATITAQNEDMTRALSLVTQGHPHHSPPSRMTTAKRAACSPNPHPNPHSHPPIPSASPHLHPHLSHVPLPLQDFSPPGLPQHLHKHHQPPHHLQHQPRQHQPQQDSLLLSTRQGLGGGTPRAPIDCNLPPLGSVPPGAPPRTASACPRPHSAAPPALNPQQELQQLLQLQQERRQNLMATHATGQPPPPPPGNTSRHVDSTANRHLDCDMLQKSKVAVDHGWAGSSPPVSGLQAAGASQQQPLRHPSFSPAAASGAFHSAAALGHSHQHDCDLGKSMYHPDLRGSSSHPAAHAAPPLNWHTQRSPAPVEIALPHPFISALAANTAGAVPGAAAALRDNSLGSRASSNKENMPTQDMLLAPHPSLHQAKASAMLPKNHRQPSPHLQEPMPQTSSTLGVDNPLGTQQHRSDDPWGSHRDWGSRHREGKSHLGAGPTVASSASHTQSGRSGPKYAAAAAGADLVQPPPQPDRRLHALVDQLRSSRGASTAQRAQGHTSCTTNSTPRGAGGQQGLGGMLHNDKSQGQCTDRAASWPASGQGVKCGGSDTRNSKGGSGGDDSGVGFGSIATAFTGERNSPAAAHASSTTAAAAGAAANEAASAHRDGTGPSPFLSFDHSGRQNAAAQMIPPDRHPLGTLHLPTSSNIPTRGMKDLPGQGMTSPASSCSSSSPSQTANPTGALPAYSFSFRNRNGPQYVDQERVQPAFGLSNGSNGAESQQEANLQLHMRSLDSEIEALGASLTAAARNVGVAAT